MQPKIFVQVIFLFFLLLVAGWPKGFFCLHDVEEGLSEDGQPNQSLDDNGTNEYHHRHLCFPCQVVTSPPEELSSLRRNENYYLSDRNSRIRTNGKKT